jgi:hypothetical protein
MVDEVYIHEAQDTVPLEYTTCLVACSLNRSPNEGSDQPSLTCSLTTSLIFLSSRESSDIGEDYIPSTSSAESSPTTLSYLVGTSTKLSVGPFRLILHSLCTT